MKPLLFLPCASLLWCMWPSTVTAQQNFVIQFDGVDDHIDMGTGIGGGVRTIEFWFRGSSGMAPSTASPGYSFIIRNDAAQTDEYGVYMRGSDWPDGRGYIYFFMRNNGVLHELRSNADYWTIGEWYHLCGTLDAEDGMKLYVNGELQAQTDPSGTAAIPASSEITAFGTWGDAMLRYAATQMDEVRFWSRALDQQEIQDRMCHWLVPGNENGLIGYWPLNEGTGTSVGDQSGFGENGQIMGATFQPTENCIDGWIGVRERPELTSMEVYPQPWDGTLTLTFAQPVQNASLAILNALGQTVRAVNSLNGSRTVLDRNTLAPGAYTLILTQRGEVIGRAKAEVAH